MAGCLTAKEANVSTGLKLLKLAISDERRVDWTGTMGPFSGNLLFIPFLKVFRSGPYAFSSSEEEEQANEEEEEEECLDLRDFFFLSLGDRTFFLLYLCP
jgi:hypothetical protein